MKRKLTVLLLLAVLSVGIGCSRSNLDKAFDIMGVVSATRAALPPIYDAITDAHPELTDEIEKFDSDFRDAELSVYNTMAAIQARTENPRDLKALLSPIVVVLDRYKLEERVPELKPSLDLIKSLLGIA
jgi:hypothetical protein